MADVKQVTLTIEGRPVTVPDGTSLLEAAKAAGVLVPHYCYHPGLPVAGVCRMCLVEVEKMPKLAPACATAAMEGQVVRVHSPKALEARQGVLEFLLVNHPLDCPVCDQAGECELQDYTFAEGRAESRYREPKRFNPVEDFGGDVLYVPNRCILCTRCVRFMSDVAQEPVLNVSERGDRAFIGKAEGHDLTNPWAGNVVDLCPVGALLSKDFLNKARAWELDRGATICTGCSQGCNAVAETRDNVVVRLKPRPNEAVNQYYLCETGRLGYRAFNRPDRLEQPMIRTGGGLAVAEWGEAIRAAAAALAGRRVVVVASPSLSNEALFLLERIIARVAGVGVFRVERGPEAPLPGAPDLALRAERAANGAGARALGFREVDAMAAMAHAGDALLLVDDDLAWAEPETLSRFAEVVHIGTVLPSALAGRVAVALPIATVLEEEGTLTNLRGRVQRFLQAKAAPGVARPSWFVLADLLAAVGGAGEYLLPESVFDALARTHAPFRGLSYAALGLQGAPLAAASAEAGVGATA
ncbi:MAG: (2Fe-2S)-binding protein [Gemmatimonadetes bacterium]|nr:(2Fe-2S)-binding protein [Gemmatimonadota bacterium]